MPETKEESLTQTAGAKVVCVPAAAAGPFGTAQEDRRDLGSEVTLGREIGAGGRIRRSCPTRGRERSPGEGGGWWGRISVCRAVGKSLDLFRCANTQKNPIRA